MTAIELLLFATPLGLLIDIVGVILIVMYGHVLFIRSGTGPPNDSVGKDGDLYIQHSRPPNEDAKRASRRRECLAYTGVGLVVFGFGLQIVGAIAAIGLTL